MEDFWFITHVRNHYKIHPVILFCDSQLRDQGGSLASSRAGGIATVRGTFSLLGKSLRIDFLHSDHVWGCEGIFLWFRLANNPEFFGFHLVRVAWHPCMGYQSDQVSKGRRAAA